MTPAACTGMASSTAVHVAPWHGREQAQVAALGRQAGEVPGHIDPLGRELENEAEENCCRAQTAHKETMLGHRMPCLGREARASMVASHFQSG